jgi:hypothetical protein
VLCVELDPTEERLVLATLDRIGAMAERDEVTPSRSEWG